MEPVPAVNQVLQLGQLKTIIENIPDKIVYCYRIWNPSFDAMPHVRFIKGWVDLSESCDELQDCMIVLDDVAAEAGACKDIATMFSAGMHHKNITVIMILHNLYMQAKFMREIMLNASYLVLYRNVRDSNQIRCLESQTGIKGLLKAYHRVTKEKYCPLLVDLLPYTPDFARLRSNLFDQHQFVYLDDDKLLK